MHNSEPVLENEMNKILWDFVIQTARQPDLMILNKKKRTGQIVDFVVPADHRVKLKECEKGDKFLDLDRELKKTIEHEIDDSTNFNRCTQYSHKRIGTRTGRLGNKRTGRDHPIVEFSLNTDKSPRDLLSLRLQ